MLRERLKQITETEDISTHSILLEELSSEIHNTIQILESEYPIDRYTCFIYVLNFTEDPEYINIASFGIGRVFAGTAFMNYLVDKNYLKEVTEGDAKEGDIVVYYNDNEIKHAGIFKSKNRVISKWGIGNLYEHSNYEVPSQYGDTIRYYKKLDKETALNYFVEFAKLNGILFEDET